jgi:acyl carrier protein
MMTTHEQAASAYATELRTLIAGVLELPVGEITPASRFIEDLDVDSLASLEIAVKVENRFGVSIGETHLASIGTVGEMIRLVESRTAEKSSG